MYSYNKKAVFFFRVVIVCGCERVQVAERIIMKERWRWKSASDRKKEEEKERVRGKEREREWILLTQELKYSRHSAATANTNTTKNLKPAPSAENKQAMSFWSFSSSL